MTNLSDAPSPTTSEATALSSVLQWSSEIPEWQKDALRRIYLNKNLTHDDIAELYNISLGQATGEPLSVNHLKDPNTAGSIVNLHRLHSLSNVNALAEGEVLSFAKKGLSIIYGDNGAGKSGYARVLKHICRSRRGPRDTILTNVFARNEAGPSACIDFGIGQQNQKATWTLGGGSDSRLSAVSVFDSSTAHVHVDGSNSLAYTPVALEILASLVDACKAVSTRYDADISNISARKPASLQVPMCKTYTTVGKLVHKLTHKTNKDELTALSILSDAENARLETLARELSEDPQTLQKQLLGRKRRVEKGLSTLSDLDAVVSEHSYLVLMEEARALKVAREASILASTELFANQPLPDVGSEVWRSLWSAAREYSVGHAYPHADFPNITDGAHCPLCHQALSEEAKARFNSFETFVCGEIEKRETLAQTAYDQSMMALKKARPTIRKVPDSVSWYRDDLGQKELSQLLRKAIVQGAWRLRAIIRLTDPDGAHQLPPLPTMPKEALEGILQAIDDSIRTLTVENDSPERKALVSERDELADRKWLGLAIPDVARQIDLLKRIDNLKESAKQTATKGITVLTGQLARSHVTRNLVTCFSQEVEKLGISSLGIELRQGSAVAGVPQFKIHLKGDTKEAAGKVLSEGEHRCVALAAFLAELATNSTKSAIVFDDPVSSLDHVHRQAVAARLAEESINRQVIVFTHDVAFLLLLEESCRSIKAPVSYRLISRGSSSPGYCHDSPPNDVLPIDQVLSSMSSHLQNVSIHHVKGNAAKWRSEVNNFDVELRTAWERAVEEVVKPVLRRLGRKVDTTGLLKLTVLTNSDHAEMRQAYGRLSMLLHNQPEGLSEKLPTPEQIRAEIDALSQWINSIRGRQESVTKLVG